MTLGTMRNRILGIAELELEALENFQGGLKRLDAKEYEKLRLSILRLGFAFPVLVWESPTGNKILDGHQRVFTLKKMRDEEEFQVGKIPVVWIQADDETEAKKLVLAASSHYAKTTEEGLADFLIDFPDLDELPSMIELPEFDIEKSLELGPTPDPPEKKERTCPNCGTKF